VNAKPLDLARTSSAKHLNILGMLTHV
jgi:hypothetical protein